MKPKNRQFTMVELAVAVAILVMALSITCSICLQGKDETIRSMKDWEEAHSLEVATEYYLICPANQLNSTCDLLPKQLRSTCIFSWVETEQIADMWGWKLGSYRVSILDSDEKEVASHEIRKLVHKDFQ